MCVLMYPITTLLTWAEVCRSIILLPSWADEALEEFFFSFFFFLFYFFPNINFLLCVL